MSEPGTKRRLGIFLVGCLAMLAVLILWFGSAPRWFRKSSAYVLVFDDAAGVTPGTPVVRSGIKVGEVEKVELDHATGDVRVVIGLPEDMPLRNAELPTIQRSMLGGDAVVALVSPGKAKLAKAEIVPPGGTLAARPNFDSTSVVAIAGQLIPPVLGALDGIKRAGDRFDQTGPALDEGLKELRDAAKATRESMPELRKAAEEIRDLARGGRELLPDVRKTTDEIRTLTRSVNDAVPDFRKTGDEVRELAKTVRVGFPDAKRMADDVQAALKTWGKVGERVDLLLQGNEDKIAKTIDRAQDAAKRLQEMLDDENQKNLREGLRSLRGSGDSLKEASELVRESRITLRHVNNTLIKADGTMAEANKLLKPLADRAPDVVKNLDQSSENLNKLTSDVRELVQFFGRTDGTVQRLISDPKLYQNLHDVSVMATRIMPRLDHMLRDLEIFADRVARHPEALGVGGAVRPSSGIK